MSFTTAISGINAQSEKLNVAGNNIANSQTVGYKNSRVLFADVFAASQGIGVRVSDTRQDFTQGSIESTGRNLDLAIAGEGFYRLEQTSGEVGYSRNGEFSLTADGFIANAQGARLTGYGLDQNVDQAAVQSGEALPFPFTDVIVGGAPQAINVPTDDLPAKQTSEAAGIFNLNSELKPGEDLNSTTFNIQTGGSQEELDLNYHFSNNYTAYDSLGNSRQVTTYFEKLADNTWLSTIAVDGQIQRAGGGAFDPAADTPQSFLLNFNQNGQLLNKADVVASGNAPVVTANSAFDILPDDAVLGVTAVDAGFTFVKADATDPDSSFVRTSNVLEAGGNVGKITEETDWITSFITDGDAVLSSSAVNLTVPGVQGANNPFTYEFDFAGSSQFANSSQQNQLSQNGYTSGSLAGITVTEDGVVMRNFTNEQSRPAGQISLASFRNEEGLEPLGNNLWAATNSSGLANLGAPGAGRFGQIQAGAVEASNVELAKELVDMIVAQRAYQANSTTISTQDELLQTIINL